MGVPLDWLNQSASSSPSGPTLEDQLLNPQQPQQQMPQSPDMGGPIGASLQGGDELQKPGGLKSSLKTRLSNFLIGGFPGLTYAGDYAQEAKNRAQMQLQSQAIQNQHIQALTNQVNTQAELAKTMVVLPNGMMAPLALAQKLAPSLYAAQSRENVANINADSRESIAKMNQGPGVMVPEIVANIAGMPELAGKPAGKALWSNLNANIRAQGYKTQDLGQEGIWVIDRVGNRIAKVGDSPSWDRMMAIGPRTTSVIVNGVPTTIPTNQLPSSGLPTASMDPGAAARKTGATAFTTGTEGDQIQSFRAFIGHADDLATFSNQFSRTSSQWANRPLNELRKKAEDNPEIGQFLAKVEPVNKEFESFLLNNRALYADDRAKADAILNGDIPPNRMDATIRSLMHTAAIRLGSLNAKYRDLYGADHPTLLDDETRSLLQKYDQLDAFNRYSRGGVPAPVRKAMTAGAVREQFSPSTGQYRYTTDNGKTWNPGRAPKQ